MTTDDPITHWIEELKAHDSRAVELIWREYYEKLVKRARLKLGSMPRRDHDEEDVALNAMYSFLRGVEKGRFPQLEDRDDLWRILLTITARKVSRRYRRHFSAKRGQGTVRGESVFMNANDLEHGAGIAEALGDEPSPELAAEIGDTYEEMLGRLGDDAMLRQIVALKLEGFTNAEIAEQLDCTTRTIERKLQRIREQWQTNSN